VWACWTVDAGDGAVVGKCFVSVPLSRHVLCLSKSHESAARRWRCDPNSLRTITLLLRITRRQADQAQSSSSWRCLGSKGRHVSRHSCTDPLLHAITHFEDTERAILETDVVLRIRQAWCAAVLSVFKHACSAAPKLQAVHSRWAALNARLSDEITTLVKTSVMNDKERANWVPWEGGSE